MSRSVFFIGTIIVVALAIGGFFLPETAKPRIEKISIEAASPVWRGMDWIKFHVTGVRDGFRTVSDMQSDNRRLVMENARLGAENALLKNLETENVRLRELLAFKSDSTYKLLAARVIQRDPSNWYNAVVINRGWADDKNLSSDQPVVTARGVVGKTGAVGQYSSRVILLVDENCKVSAVTENSQARGIVVGATSLNAGQPLCRITLVARESEFAVGERVFTTGLGGAFPANLLLGTIKEAPPLSADKNFGLYRDGALEPAVDLNNLQEVFVLTGVK